MNYHMVLNGFLPDVKKQCAALTHFINQCSRGVSWTSAIIIAKSDEVAGEVKEWVSASELVIITCTHFQPEAILQVLTPLINPEDVYLFDHSYGANELAVRVAARLRGSSALGVDQMEVKENHLTISRMVYSNYMRGTFLLEQGPYCIAIGEGLGEGEIPDDDPRSRQHTVSITVKKAALPDFIQSRKLCEEAKKTTLADARCLLIAGRGMEHKDQVEKLAQLAKKMGGVLGVSRPAAMNAWAPMQQLIGVSGTMANPDLCITAGISGAAAFYAGIEKSKFIVAINKDKNAPIMKKADVAVVEDAAAIIQELDAIITSSKDKEKSDE